MQRDFYAHENLAFNTHAAEQTMRTFLADPSLGRLLLIEGAGFAIVTFSFSFEFRGRAALLDELYIAPHARGGGLGTDALRFVEQLCIDEGVQVLQLEVAEKNIRANALYQRNGFFDRDNRLLSKHLHSRVVETPRLRMRPVSEADIELLHRIWTDADVRRYLWDDRVIERDVAAEVVHATLADWRERNYGLWVVFENDEPIGFAGFRSSEEDARPELLFGFLPSHWHRGLATEAASAALDYAFHVVRCDAVCGATDPPNQASVRVMERIGMTFERRGTLNGLDTLFFAIRNAGVPAG